MRIYPALELGVGFLKILDKYPNGDIAAGAFKDARTRGRVHGPDLDDPTWDYGVRHQQHAMIDL